MLVTNPHLHPTALLAAVFNSPLHPLPIPATMKDRMERLVVLPFSVGCVSNSSIGVADDQPRKSHDVSVPSPGGWVEEVSDERTAKALFGVFPLPRSGISAGLQKLIRSFKGLSQLFSFREEEEGGAEMVIGLPTDVQHVAHVGLNGSDSFSNLMGWQLGNISPELLSLPYVSARHV